MVIFKNMTLFILKLLTLLWLLKNVVLAFDTSDIVCSLFPSNSSSVSFFLYAKSVENFSVILDEKSVKNAPFNTKSNTVILIVHGFNSSSRAVNMVSLRKAFFSGPQNYNVLMVDYSNVIGDVSKSDVITFGLKYALAAICDFTIVANAITEIIDMIQNLRPEITNIRMVGYSFGAQLIGLSGKQLMEKKKPVNRATGLDPASPLFSTPYITQESGLFVDVYHTQCGDLKGDRISSGHVDFYVNNAVVQDGCRKEKPYEKALECSHKSAILYFAESINNHNRMASRCEEITTIIENLNNLYNIDENNNNVLSSTCTAKANSEGSPIVFGENVSHNARGVYFIRIPRIPNIA